MKYFLVVILAVLFLLPLGAQIPQRGSYYFEIVGTDLVIDVDINGNQWDFDFGDGIKSRQTVTVDGARNAIRIPIFAGFADDFVYNEGPGFIDFYRGNAFNLNLYDMMAAPIISIGRTEGISRIFSTIILDHLNQSFSRAPLLRLRPNR